MTAPATSTTDRPWALFPRGLLVFERAEPGAETRLLVSRVDTCATPGCSCRDADFVAVSIDVDDGFDPEVALATDVLHEKFAAAGMNARLDIDAGIVEPDDYEGRVPLTADWARYLESQIDGELLDLLHEKWLQGKGWKPVEKTDWEPREPATLVGWYEAHPSDREDLFDVDDRVFRAEDLYCVNPGCTCNEVTFVFSTRDAPDLGSLRVRLPGIDIVSRDVKSRDAETLSRLWSAFSKRHRQLAGRMTDRQKTMRALAATHRQTHRAPTAPPTSVGRNAPCPCGSGKKFKRCCG